MEMDSPHKHSTTHFMRPQPTRNPQPPPPNFDNYHPQQTDVYLEGLDVFDEFEQKFNDFLRSTPYID